MSIRKIDLIKLYKQKTALVIDDYPDMRGSIRRMLVTFGIEQIDTASNGDEAILKCDEQQFDIILADYNLGDGKTGQQILEEMRYKRSLKSTSLYMMITAETTKSMVFGALEYQPDDYLTKPFTQAVLQKRLDRMVLEKEALYEINHAIDMLDFDHAIELCKARMALKDKYERRCLRLMGDCFIKKHKYGQAKQVYQNVLQERPVEWASIGLGKSLLALGELDRAEDVFSELVDNGCLCLEVYDFLADIKNRKGEPEVAQQLLEQAIEISPNAIMRQQSMAVLCENNRDWQRAEASHKKVIRLGNNSVYESPEQHFNLVRCIGKELKDSTEKPRQRIKDAEELLRRVRKKYRDKDNIDLQSDIIEANVYADAGQVEESLNRLPDLEKRLVDSGSSSAELSLDMARTYRAVGEDAKCDALLRKLAEQHADDEKICLAIDAMSDEPITAHGKRKAVELNNTGKQLFANQEYSKAVQLFNQALLHYPQNIGLNLNLMLALVKKMNKDGASPEEIKRCKGARAVLSELDQSSPLHERYQALCGHLNKLEKTL